MSLSKRHFLRGSAYVVAAGMLRPCIARAASMLKPTYPMALGPFYPVQKPIEDHADMTRLAGHTKRAKGPLLELTGRVLDVEGRPVAAADVQVWQANAAGRYLHHGDHNVRAPLDPDFQYYAVQKTDADGRFRFLTVKPGAYPAGDYMRSPHIHFDVAGKYDRLITQMYFSGDPWLMQDQTLLQDIGGKTNPMPERIFGKLTPGGSKLDAAATLCQFDVVLVDG
jgi:protocatechuate 3,4-dioxygenase, beta subunit